MLVLGADTTGLRSTTGPGSLPRLGGDSGRGRRAVAHNGAVPDRSDTHEGCALVGSESYSRPINKGSCSAPRRVVANCPWGASGESRPFELPAGGEGSTRPAPRRTPSWHDGRVPGPREPARPELPCRCSNSRGSECTAPSAHAWCRGRCPDRVAGARGKRPAQSPPCRPRRSGSPLQCTNRSSTCRQRQRRATGSGARRLAFPCWCGGWSCFLQWAPAGIAGSRPDRQGYFDPGHFVALRQGPSRVKPSLPILVMMWNRPNYKKGRRTTRAEGQRQPLQAAPEPGPSNHPRGTPSPGGSPTECVGAPT